MICPSYGTILHACRIPLLTPFEKAISGIDSPSPVNVYPKVWERPMLRTVAGKDSKAADKIVAGLEAVSPSAVYFNITFPPVTQTP